ncbi:MAG: VWA domain-containing protein [Acidobacteria bacterium]|nr:VWA domain-containing protein [Acidobacteriota bacterium]
MSMTAPDDPFASVVGQSLAKRALLMLAVEPRLGGLLMASPSGTGRRRLVKAFASLLEALKPGGQDAALVRVPLGVGEDRLLGGLSPEPAAAGPRWRYREGLLARADRGVLQVDHINLLPESSLRAIASALDSGRVRVEREGTSTSHPAGFALVGTYDPAEGHPAAIIRARVGLLVDGASAADLDQRRQVLELLAGFEQSRQGGEPAAEPPGFGPAGAAAESIRQARSLLGRVDFGDDDLRRLISAAARLGVEGHRLDLFAMLAARANAALSGRGRVCGEDLEMASQLVLWPRAFPVDEEPPPAPRPEQVQPESGQGAEPAESDPGPRTEDHSMPADESPMPVDPLPGEFPDEMVGELPAARAGGRRTGPGTRRLPGYPGRAFRTGPRPDRRRSIAVAATLRAAAPWQSWRRRHSGASPAGDRDRPPDPGRGSKGGAGSRMICRASDLRFRRFRGKAGILFVFVVDASGSMAVNRMAQAKGAMARLLQQAYVFRDQVALVRFGGEGAETLLPPTRSLQRAKRLVEALPASGATPLAAGLVQALGVARAARLRGSPQPVLLILTDGRANRPARPVPSGPGPTPAALQQELRLLGAEIRREALTAVVVDTRPSFLAGEEGRSLADWTGARYLQLPRTDQGALFRAVKSVAEDVRSMAVG